MCDDQNRSANKRNSTTTTKTLAITVKKALSAQTQMCLTLNGFFSCFFSTIDWPMSVVTHLFLSPFLSLTLWAQARNTIHSINMPHNYFLIEIQRWRKNQNPQWHDDYSTFYLLIYLFSVEPHTHTHSHTYITSHHIVILTYKFSFVARSLSLCRVSAHFSV